MKTISKYPRLQENFGNFPGDAPPPPPVGRVTHPTPSPHPPAAYPSFTYYLQMIKSCEPRSEENGITRKMTDKNYSEYHDSLNRIHRSLQQLQHKQATLATFYTKKNVLFLKNSINLFNLGNISMSPLAIDKKNHSFFTSCKPCR